MVSLTIINNDRTAPWVHLALLIPFRLRWEVSLERMIFSIVNLRRRFRGSSVGGVRCEATGEDCLDGCDGHGDWVYSTGRIVGGFAEVVTTFTALRSGSTTKVLYYGRMKKYLRIERMRE